MKSLGFVVQKAHLVKKLYTLNTYERSHLTVPNWEQFCVVSSKCQSIRLSIWVIKKKTVYRLLTESTFLCPHPDYFL